MVGLEHPPLRVEHREHAPLGVVGELEALTPVCLGVVLVGPDQPHYLAVAVVDIADLGERRLFKENSQSRQIFPRS